MFVEKIFIISGNHRYALIDEPTHCPRCHYAIKPDELYCQAHLGKTSKPFCAALYLCRNCFEPFVVKYPLCSNESGYGFDTKFDFIGIPQYCGPSTPQDCLFDKYVEALSPSFVSIYNQSAYAEDLGLKDVAGIGYRKALEFLVKDFCIHIDPEDEDAIKKDSLNNCIKKYIESPNIKTLASRSAWLGNDEAHYLRKHDDRDVEDLKRFITACSYFVGMVITSEDAESISPR